MLVFQSSSLSRWRGWVEENIDTEELEVKTTDYLQELWD